jgi:hypothetical protein
MSICNVLLKYNSDWIENTIGQRNPCHRARFIISDQAKHKSNYTSLWLYSPIHALAASMKLSVSLQLLDLEQLAGLLGRVISSSQGFYLYTNTERTHNTNTKHPCPEWDSNPRPRSLREQRQLMPYLDRSATVTGLPSITNKKKNINV